MRKVLHGVLPALLMVLTPLAFASTGVTPHVQGQPVTGTNAGDRVSRYAMFRGGISLDEAVARAERQYRARVVRTDIVDEDGRTVYVLKLLSEDGRVFTVRIDASTGRMR